MGVEPSDKRDGRVRQTAGTVSGEPGDGMDPMGDQRRAREEDAGPIGLFPSWRWVYGTVLVYGALMILALWGLTRLLDPGTVP